MNVLYLGNEHLHQLTAQGKYNLRINLEDFDKNKKYATYKQFAVGDESQYTSWQLVDIRVMQVRLKTLDVYQSNACWS
jgi:hypothetical protein